MKGARPFAAAESERLMEHGAGPDISLTVPSPSAERRPTRRLAFLAAGLLTSVTDYGLWQTHTTAQTARPRLVRYATYRNDSGKRPYSEMRSQQSRSFRLVSRNAPVDLTSCMEKNGFVTATK